MVSAESSVRRAEPSRAARSTCANGVINYYYDPAVMAQVAAWVNYISPITGTKEIISADDPETAENPLIFPSEDVLSRSKVFRGLTAEEETRYARAFSDLTAS